MISFFSRSGFARMFVAGLIAGVPLAVSSQTLAPGVKLVPVAKGYPVYNTASFNRQSLTTFKNDQYFAFYNPAGNMTLARRTLGTTNWQVYETRFQPNSATDGHDTVSIGVDGEGILHTAWGMHAQPLNYARTTNASSLQVARRSMTGTEQSVTYPQFINLPDGDLLFIYRSGSSGSGDTILNRWHLATHTWSRIQNKFIDGISTHVNAYPNFACFDSHTNLHLSWCWRDTPDFNSNHDILYAWSPDFGVTWKKWGGEPYSLPIRQSTAQVILPMQTRNMLMNQCGMTLDRNDYPIIATWWAPAGGTGNPVQVMVVWNDGKAWRTNQVTQRKSNSWPGRPIIVADKANRIFVVYGETEQGGRPMLAWSEDPQHAVWHLVQLTSESLGGWEPVYDPQEWERDGKLHLFYQKIGGGSGGTMVSVLEFDPAVYINSLASGSAPLR
jgi:hypothetical protein